MKKQINNNHYQGEWNTLLSIFFHPYGRFWTYLGYTPLQDGFRFLHLPLPAEGFGFTPHDVDLLTKSLAQTSSGLPCFAFSTFVTGLVAVFSPDAIGECVNGMLKPIYQHRYRFGSGVSGCFACLP
jgi:hypothetical protein